VRPDPVAAGRGGRAWGAWDARLRSSPRFEPFRVALARIGLPAWFVVIDLLWLAKPDLLGIDARHYQRAAAAWLGGGDPWAVTEGGIKYASGPHTLLFYAPTNPLPLAVSVAFWMVVGLGASVWLVRRLEIPLWWLAFPPLFHAIWNGNPQTIVLALLILGGPLAAAVAVLFKLYAALPILLRPRLKVWVAVGMALLVTLPLLPWQLYLQDGLGIGDHLASAWNGSAWRIPILVAPTLLGLWILRRDGADWLAVPAIWPATQFYYVSMALPVAARRPILAAALALPVPLMTPIAVMVMAALKVWRERHERQVGLAVAAAPQP
jgi:hypothetical protein